MLSMSMLLGTVKHKGWKAYLLSDNFHRIFLIFFELKPADLNEVEPDDLEQVTSVSLALLPEECRLCRRR